MRKRATAVLLAAFAISSMASCSSEAPEMPVMQTESVSLSKPEAGEDYYGYANFDFITNSQIPYNKTSFGTFDNIQNELEKTTSALIDRCVSNDTPTDKNELLVKELYKQYLDFDAREKAGINALLPIIGMIENSSTPDELVSALGTMYQEYGVSSFFRFNVDPDSYDTSVNILKLMNCNTCGNMKENFTKTDAGSEQIGDLTKKMLIALEVDDKEAHERAVNVTKMVTDIAYATMDSEYLMNIEKHYNPYDTDSLQKL